MNMEKQIIIFKTLEDYNKAYKEFKKDFPNLQMVIVDRVEKINDFSFKDYSLIISFDFNKEEKDILSKKVKKDSTKSDLEIIILHK